MAYFIYEYPNGKGYITTQRDFKTEDTFKGECSSIREAKDFLREIIAENYRSGKIKR